MSPFLLMLSEQGYVVGAGLMQIYFVNLVVT